MCLCFFNREHNYFWLLTVRIRIHKKWQNPPSAEFCHIGSVDQIRNYKWRNIDLYYRTSIVLCVLTLCSSCLLCLLWMHFFLKNDKAMKGLKEERRAMVLGFLYCSIVTFMIFNGERKVFTGRCFHLPFNIDLDEAIGYSWNDKGEPALWN